MQGSSTFLSRHLAVVGVTLCACGPLAPDDEISDGAVDVTREATAASPDAIDEREDAAPDAPDASTQSDADADAGAPAPVLPRTATGDGFGCHIDAQGNVWCWGDNEFGQVGVPASDSPVSHPSQVTTISNAEALALGEHHACVVANGGQVYCWGLNDAYQLGHAPATENDGICPGLTEGATVPCSATPVLVKGVSGATAIASAGAFSCIVTTAGTVQCWGANQLTATADAGVACGSGPTPSGVCYPAPYTVSGLNGVTSLAVAFDHACVLAPGDGGFGVFCWGNNEAGQVSPYACSDSICSPPTQRSDLSGSTAVAAGNAFTCALGPDGGVRCAGDNTFGQLGHTPGTEGDLGVADIDSGLGIYNAAPLVVQGLQGVGALAGGGHASACAIEDGGTAVCWGHTTDSGSATPSLVFGLPAMSAIGPFDADYVCGDAADGTVWCWNLGGGAARMD